MIFWIGTAVVAGWFVWLLRGTRRGFQEMGEYWSDM